MNKTEKYTYIAIIILLIFASLLVFKVHYKFQYYRTVNDGCTPNYCEKTPINYPYPIHSDEWAQLARAIHMMDNNALTNINPYTGTLTRNFEPGFTVFLAQFFTMTKFNPIYTYQYLPVISIIIILLSLIVFCYVWTGSYITGILSAIFLLSIQSTVNILGVWFFLPLTFSLSILFMYNYALLTKNIYLMATFFLVSILIYPILTILLVLLTVPYLLTILKHQRKKMLLIIITLFTTSIISMLIYFQFDLKQILPGLLFKYGWTTGFERIYGPIDHFMIVGWIFGIIGVYFMFKKQLAKNIIIPLIFCGLLVSSWSIYGFSILIPYQRAYLYMLILISIFSGIGAYHLLKIIYNIPEKRLKSYSIKISIITLASLSIMAVQYHNYYKTSDPTFWPQLYISESDIDTLNWIRDSTNVNSKIIVPTKCISAIYPVGKRKTIAMIPSNLESGEYQLIKEFYASTNCKRKNDIIEKTQTNYIYSYNQISCGFKEVYKKNGIYIYMP